MFRFLCLTVALSAVLVSAAAPARAQDVMTKESVASLKASFVADLDTLHQKFLGLAQAFPQDKYSWRPMDGVRSVSDVLMLAAFEGYSFIPQSAHDLNVFITVAALLTGASQIVFFYNLVWSYFRGEPAGSNPWHATTLEWQTPQTPPVHGNWGKTMPVVHRWAYDYSVPGAKDDFIPQTVAPEDVVSAEAQIAKGMGK